MKSSVIASLLFLATTLYSQPVNSQNNDLFGQGAGFYSEGRYYEAIESWKQLYSDGIVTAELCYNLGNAFYKVSDISGAILWYERARRIAPLDENILHNLELTRERTVDRFDEIPELFLTRWFKTLSLLISSNTWAAISLFLFTLSVSGFLLFFLTRSYVLGRSAITTAIAALVISLFSVLMAYNNKSLLTSQNSAVITSSVVTGLSSPGEGANELFVVHEGTMVEITEKVSEWYEVRLPDGNIGWIRQNSVEII